MSHVAVLGEFVADTIDRGLHPARASDARMRILDTVGNALAAAPEEPVRIVRRVAEQQGGSGEAHIWGSVLRLPAASAALVNGTMAHALDFDDTHLPSVLHPSASVVPAVLAAAATAGASADRTLAAIAAGNEVTIRLGTAGYDAEVGNSLFFEKGLHATSICGTIGAAAACAVLFGGDAAVAAHAMGVAASMGAGLIEANRTGGSVKRIQDADVVFITLGLTEIWWDDELDIPMNVAPIHWKFARKSNRFRFVSTNFQENLTAVRKMIELIREKSTKDVKIILTVSPVPLNRTFTD